MAVKVGVFLWAGKWGPFHIRVPCGECTLTLDIIRDALSHELSAVPTELDVHDWLSGWWRALARGGWHAPIVLVNGRIISQGSALNRGVLSQAVIEAYVRTHPVVGNVLFGKHGCPHCERARGYLAGAGIDYDYRDVVKSPVALYEMLARVKSRHGPASSPVTVPQIWLEGRYIGNADALNAFLEREPGKDRKHRQA